MGRGIIEKTKGRGTGREDWGSEVKGFGTGRETEREDSKGREGETGASGGGEESKGRG